MINDKITVAVINHNTKKHLKECLLSILNQEIKTEVVVVDNASTDGSQKMVSEEFSSIQLIQNKRNLGFSRAVNQVMSKNNRGYIFILNSDTKLKKNCLTILLKFMEKEKRAGVVGPKILNEDGSLQFSRRHFPSLVDATFHAFLGNVFPNNLFSRRYKMAGANQEKTQKVDWLSGAAMFIRLNAAHEIGLFDEGYFMFVEDMDFCFRLWQKKWQVYYHPQAEIIHYVGGSASQKPIFNIIEHQKSIWRFYVKNKKGLFNRLLLPVVGIGLIVRTAILVSAKLIMKNQAKT